MSAAIVVYVVHMSSVSSRLLAPAAIALAALFAVPGHALTTDTPARSAMLLELGTGAPLLRKGADERIPPASMSKLMTLEVVFRALKEGRLTLDDEFEVSEAAWRMGGSKMFVRVDSRVRIEDLIRGIVVSSGNDACLVVAEGMDGSEEAFAERLNRRAREIGLTGSNFTNASGWPHPDHYMTPRDLAALAGHIVRSYPQYMPYFEETEFTWEGITQTNRNPLLFADIGADGLKTGHTSEAGYSLVGTAVRNDRRLVLVVAGLDSAKQRASESRRLLEWGFREFDVGTFFRPGEELAEARVWMGAKPQVALTPGRPLIGSAAVTDLTAARATVAWHDPVQAPVEKGQELGTVTVTLPDGPAYAVPLVATESVERGGFFIRLLDLLDHAFSGGGGR